MLGEVRPGGVALADADGICGVDNMLLVDAMSSLLDEGDSTGILLVFRLDFPEDVESVSLLDSTAVRVTASGIDVRGPLVADAKDISLPLVDVPIEESQPGPSHRKDIDGDPVTIASTYS